MIRRGREDDLAALTELYNHYVEHTPVTFDLAPFAVEARRPWLGGFAERGPHQLFVAEEDGRVLGWAGAHRFREKRAYDTTVETTIYLASGATGRGLGSALYERLFAALAGEDVHRAVAGITLPNDASVALHRRFGFREIGVFHEVGRKRGRYWDVLWLEKEL
jgi:phosphinothricin acetyltransferase